MASDRIRKINELLHQELSTALVREDILPPGTMVTLTQVTTSADLSYADISYSVLPADRQAKTQELLQRQAGRLRSLLAHSVVLRKVPELRFHIDHAEEHAAHIDALIDKIHDEE